MGQLETQKEHSPPSAAVQASSRSWGAMTLTRAIDSTARPRRRGPREALELQRRNRRRVEPLIGRPTVSVCIPCYNYGHFLPGTLASVLGQEGVELEVLVIDDASP